MQGRHARLYTAVGLGVVVVAGALAALRDASTEYTPGDPLRHPRRASAWSSAGSIFRLVQYPPFVEFLIATEAEMNKVSWTSRDDLYRATIVVLVTVTLMAVFLFGVDWLWSNLLQTARRPEVRRRRCLRLQRRLTAPARRGRAPRPCVLDRGPRRPGGPPDARRFPSDPCDSTESTLTDSTVTDRLLLPPHGAA